LFLRKILYFFLRDIFGIFKIYYFERKFCAVNYLFILEFNKVFLPAARHIRGVARVKKGAVLL